jgi:alpha-beta hydrolase superfamily lysophospholipase
MHISTLRAQQPAASRADVLYVHGSTFGADLSLFYAFDGRSWADALNDGGLAAWGFDFTGYGQARRHADGARPAGRLADALSELRQTVQALRARNGGRRVVLLGHSWGGTVAAACAAACPDDVAALVLFAPIVMRQGALPAPSGGASHYLVSAWAQYRRFVEDVPRGQAQVFSEAHFEAWSAAFLASDPQARMRMPPAVRTPAGPQHDVQALWSGQALYAPERIVAPTLLVCGEWDSVCNAADAVALLAALGGVVRDSVVIEHGTHLMHLEAQREELYAQVNRFLREQGAALSRAP